MGARLSTSDLFWSRIRGSAFCSNNFGCALFHFLFDVPKAPLTFKVFPTIPAHNHSKLSFYMTNASPTAPYPAHKV